MKLAFAIGLFIVVVLVGFQIVSFLEQKHALTQNMADISAKLAAAKLQEADLQEEAKYLSNPANLEKELRTQFNYKKPGETMIIIVPKTSSTPQ